MAKATINSGKLNVIPDCYIAVGGSSEPVQPVQPVQPQSARLEGGLKYIDMYILPDISDSKSANYAPENGIGRSNPFTIFSYSELRTISWTCHFIIQNLNGENTADRILDNIRTLQSAVYPRDSFGSPPPLCKLKCGELLSSDEVCAVLRSYSVKYDTSVPWFTERPEPDFPGSLVPYKIDVDLQFDVVYNQTSLPISSKIMTTGY
jgi:hypothetical protein